MKKTVLSFTAVLLLLAGCCLIGTGFQKRSDAYIADFSVSADGGEMTLYMGVASSAGYLRKVKVREVVSGSCGTMQILIPYAAFGGVNGRLCARDTFTIPLAADTETIALYRTAHACEPVLQKQADGMWRRMEPKETGK